MKLARHALALAIIAASSSAFALDQLTDDALSNATGQAGLTIITNMGGGVAGTLDYTDTDGSLGSGSAAFASGTYTSKADVLVGFNLTGKTTTTIDVGANGNLSNVVVDVSTDTTTGFTTSLTSVTSCANSNVSTSTGVCSTGSASILSLPATGVAITLKGLDLQVTLGSASASTHFISAALPSTFNLTIGTGTAAGAAPQLSILDPNNFSSAATAGGIGVSELLIAPTNVAGTTTTVDACTTTVTAMCASGIAGLQIKSNAILNVTAYNVALGQVGTGTATAAIGNVALDGLNTSTMTTFISGH